MSVILLLISCRMRMKYISKGQGQYYIILKTSLLNKGVNNSN